MLIDLEIFEDFLGIILLMTFNSFVDREHTLNNLHYFIFNKAYFVIPQMQFVLRNVPCASEKRVYSFLGGWDVL